jgi:hypothetical protein
MTTQDIKSGDYVEIPKGTTVFTKPYNGAMVDPASNEQADTKSTRVVNVESIQTLTVWVNDADANEVHAYDPGNYGRTHKDKTFTKVDKGQIVIWSKKKWTYIANVTKVEAPVEKATSKEPPLRQRLVEDSTWKINKNIPHYKKDAGTPFDNGHGYKWTEHALVLEGEIPADVEFKVRSKPVSGHPDIGYPSSRISHPIKSEGLWVDVLFTKGERNGESMVDKRTYVRVTDLTPVVEQLSKPEPEPAFVIQDKVTKKYYAGYEYGAYDYTTHTRAAMSLTMVDKLSKAKKFKRLNDARVHCLVQSGYYDDLPSFWGEVPDWMQGGKMFDIPDTWEIVKYDKLSKDVIANIELLDTFNRTWSLRGLTVKYGSAVRAIYSDLDKKNKLDEFQAIMVYTKTEDDVSSKYYWDIELTDAEKAEFADMVAQVDKKDIKTHKSTTGFAIGVKDISTAAWMKLMYTGKLKANVINLTTMTEVLETEKPNE